MASLANIRPGADTDDKSAYPGGITSDCFLGNAWGNLYQAGIRFLNVGVPKDSTVSSAVITFRAADNCAGTTCKVKIKGEANATPDTFSTEGDLTGRTRTTEYVDWTIAAWTVNTYYDTPNFSAVLQEIFALAGWASGNNLVVFFDNDSSTYHANRNAYQYGNSSTYCANLAITYEAPATAKPYCYMITSRHMRS